jgi:hypothetical protein
MSKPERARERERKSHWDEVRTALVSQLRRAFGFLNPPIAYQSRHRTNFRLARKETPRDFCELKPVRPGFTELRAGTPGDLACPRILAIA